MVKWTNHALVQLRHIHNYIAQDSPLYAKRVSDALVRKTFLLDELPRMGRVVPELKRGERPGAVEVLLPYPLPDQDHPYRHPGRHP